MVRPASPSADAIEAALTWIRAATGRYLVADTPPPVTPMAPRATPRMTTPGRGATFRGSQAREAPTRGFQTETSPKPIATGDPEKALANMAGEVAACTRCTLCESRTQTVYGIGSAKPKLVIVGEAPGAEEDRVGEPFVGPAGQLLDKMLGAIGLDRTSVYICNVLKCRPPNNRDPHPDEVSACKSWLDAQLEALNPPLILALGTPAARSLLGTRRGITSLRGRYARSVQGYRVMPSFHPAYLLRNPAAKREAWADLQKVAEELGLDIPGK